MIEKIERPCLTTFPNTSKFVKKYFVIHVLSSYLLSVWKCGETRFFVLYILFNLQAVLDCVALFLTDRYDDFHLEGHQLS